MCDGALHFAPKPNIRSFEQLTLVSNYKNLIWSLSLWLRENKQHMWVTHIHIHTNTQIQIKLFFKIPIKNYFKKPKTPQKTQKYNLHTYTHMWKSLLYNYLGKDFYFLFLNPQYKQNFL